jgi:hypothetical protein
MVGPWRIVGAMSEERCLGHKPGPIDAHARHVEHLVGAMSGTGDLPASRSMRGSVLQFLRQKQTNSCVAHAIAHAILLRWAVSGQVDLRPISTPALYWEARRYDGLDTMDAGCFVRSAFHAIDDYGFCPMDAYPLEVNGQVRNVLETPPPSIYRASFDQSHQLQRYTCLDRVDIKRAIASGFPVTLAITVDRAFMDLSDNRVWEYVEDPNQTDTHYVCGVGYDEESLEIQNSWGQDWGDGGFARVGWDTVENTRRTAEIYAITTVPRFA